VHDFTSRDDLIDACLASTHIPMFMDGTLSASFRGKAYIDSDLMTLRRGSTAAALPIAGAPSVRIASGKDPRIRKIAQKFGASLQLMSKDGIEEMQEWGRRHVHVLDSAGKLEALEALRLETPPGADGEQS
jgi:hypothetical protein